MRRSSVGSRIEEAMTGTRPRSRASASKLCDIDEKNRLSCSGITIPISPDRAWRKTARLHVGGIALFGGDACGWLPPWLRQSAVCASFRPRPLTPSRARRQQAGRCHRSWICGLRGSRFVRSAERNFLTTLGACVAECAISIVQMIDPEEERAGPKSCGNSPLLLERFCTIDAASRIWPFCGPSTGGRP